MAARCKRVADSGAFQGFIMAVIVANAVTLGIQTYPLSDAWESRLNTLDDVFLGIFVVELTIRLAAFGSRPQDFFKDGWNVFDFTVVFASFLPFLRGDATILRVLRLLRVVRIVTVLPDLRVLVRAMARSIPPITSLAVLTLLIMYVYAMVGWILFHEQAPDNWGDLGQAMLTTFTMLTLENWPSLLEQGMAIHQASWIYFVSYILIASFLVINVLIAIIINSMEEVHDAERQEERDERLAALEAGDADAVTIADRLTALRTALDELETDLGESTGGRATVARPTKGGRARM